MQAEHQPIWIMSGVALVFGLIVFGIGPFWLRRVFNKAREADRERMKKLIEIQRRRDADKAAKAPEDEAQS